MRAGERADRDLMRDHTAEPLAWEPAVEAERRRFDLERRFPQMLQIEVNRVIGRGTDCGRHTSKRRQRRTMNMPGSDKLHARMTPHNRRKFTGIDEILAVHVPDAGLERRM